MDARTRSSHGRQAMALYSGLGGEDEPSPEERIVELEREAELAQRMAAEAEKVRDSATELQRLAREMRRDLASASTF
jgi:hypothetical protein